MQKNECKISQWRLLSIQILTLVTSYHLRFVELVVVGVGVADFVNVSLDRIFKIKPVMSKERNQTQYFQNQTKLGSNLFCKSNKRKKKLSRSNIFENRTSPVPILTRGWCVTSFMNGPSPHVNVNVAAVIRLKCSGKICVIIIGALDIQPAMTKTRLVWVVEPQII